jgi:hypothetical protein
MRPDRAGFVILEAQMKWTLRMINNYLNCEVQEGKDRHAIEWFSSPPPMIWTSWCNQGLGGG